MKKFKFKIDGNNYEAGVEEGAENVLKIEVNGKTFEVTMEKEAEAPTTPAQKRFEPRPVPPKPEVVKSGNVAKKVISPLPGVIHSILVKEGDKVKMGETVVILEAMKMENSIVAEVSGTIQSIKVTVNSSVLQGDVLIEIA